MKFNVKEMWVMFLLGAIFGGALTSALFAEDYKQGQIDYASGNIQYELVKKPNGETKWEKK